MVLFYFQTSYDKTIKAINKNELGLVCYLKLEIVVNFNIIKLLISSVSQV